MKTTMKLGQTAIQFFIGLAACSLILAGCGTKQNNADATPAPGTHKTWSSPPAMKIDTSKSYSAEVTTSKGTFTVDLFAKDAPKTVNNFVFLSKQNYYNGVPFHRIIAPFMIQTGDPTGTGSGGPGYKFDDELSNKHTYDTGVVAMANAGPNTNGSQFFICTGDQSQNLNSMPNYTIFGKISAGMDVIQKIAATPVVLNPRSGEESMPKELITIDAIKIIEK